MTLFRVVEREGWSVGGIPVLLAALLGLPAGLAMVATTPAGPALVMPLLAVALLLLRGLYVVQPNEARVLLFFGRYQGTVHESGLRFSNPLCSRKRISVRVRNFESAQLKVNDNDGNPVEIGAVIVWQVDDTAEALFQVDDYQHFVQVQSEAALRNLAMLYPYDATDPDVVTLRSHPIEIASRLRAEVQDRLSEAGVKVLEAQLSHLAYAPEIARAMLQRQQASAIVAARETIVEGAVGMVEGALTKLRERAVVELDEPARAKLASNLLVVLCADNPAQPVIGTGS